MTITDDITRIVPDDDNFDLVLTVPDDDRCHRAP
jgi:hypothetical protein